MMLTIMVVWRILRRRFVVKEWLVKVKLRKVTAKFSIMRRAKIVASSWLGVAAIITTPHSTTTAFIRKDLGDALGHWQSTSTYILSKMLLLTLMVVALTEMLSFESGIRAYTTSTMVVRAIVASRVATVVWKAPSAIVISLVTASVLARAATLVIHVAILIVV